MSRDPAIVIREMLSAERGFIKKDPGGRISIALVYPNRYGLGMSNLGFQAVYRMLNQRDDVLAERVFLPEDMSLRLQAGTPVLSMESQRPLASFHLVAFSLSFENDYPNAAAILAAGSIPVVSEKRGEGFPLVMAGGITTFLNPEPLAPIMDLFLLGEAEAVLPPFLEGLTEALKKGLGKRDVLYHLSMNCIGVYVPSLYGASYDSDGRLSSFSPLRPGVPARVKALKAPLRQTGVLRSAILSASSEFGDKALIEAARGCGRSCRFCAAGFVYRPPRFHDEGCLKDAVAESLRECNQVGLLAAAVSDVPGITAVTGEILQRGASFSVSSLRAEALTPELLEHLNACGQRVVTIAPEAGSDRLRCVINKHLSEETILNAAALIASRGSFSVRLYFLIGLPTETQKDIEAIPALVKKIRHRMIKESASRGRIGEIRLSINCFVPKPFTPFQWHPMEDEAALKEKQRWLKAALSREGGVKAAFDVPKWAYLQALLSLGDRRAGSILLKALELDWDWKRAYRSSQVNPDFFVLRPKKQDELLPWDFIEHGLSKDYLAREYRLAMEGRQSSPCNLGRCTMCGVCEEADSVQGERINCAKEA